MGVWIAKVVLVINLVVRTEKKWPRANAIGTGSDEGKKKAARGCVRGTSGRRPACS